MATAPMGAPTGGQSAWHHAASTYGGMGEQHAGNGNTIAMKGGKSRRRTSRRTDRKTSRRTSRRTGRRNQRGGRR